MPFHVFEVCQLVWPKLHVTVELQSRPFAYVTLTLDICRTNIYLYKFSKNLNFDTDFYHNAIITTITVSTFNNNKTPAKAFTPPADEKKMGTIWIFVYYAIYGSGRGRCRDFLVLKWGGGVLICKYGI